MLFLLRMLRRTSRHSAWLLPLLIIGFVFVTGWVALALVEPESDIVKPATYWWWFLVTATTVGYGDIYPQTGSGRVVAAFIIIGSIVSLAVVFSRVAGVIENTKGHRMRGESTVIGTGHIVILGYAPGRTDRLIAELLSEPEREVVLGVWDDQLSEHPLPGDPRVHFVRGDLTDDEVLGRAALDRAHSMLIDARDDNEAVTLAVSAHHLSPQLHTVVALRDLTVRRTIDRVDPTAHCVQWHNTQLITEELVDPGIAEVYQELATAGGPGTFSAIVPTRASKLGSYGDWQVALGREHGITILAVRDSASTTVSPQWDYPVMPGTQLFYIGTRRLSPKELEAALPGE